MYFDARQLHFLLSTSLTRHIQNFFCWLSEELGLNNKHISHSSASGQSQVPNVPLGAAVLDLATTQQSLPHSSKFIFMVTMIQFEYWKLSMPLKVSISHCENLPTSTLMILIIYPYQEVFLELFSRG